MEGGSSFFGGGEASLIRRKVSCSAGLVGKVDQACSNGGRAEEDEGAEDHHDPVPKREAACGHGETDEGYRQDTQGYGGIGKDGVR